jgi:hypothetical protein
MPQAQVSDKQVFAARIETLLRLYHEPINPEYVKRNALNA